jgi:hypothetical protein
MSVPERVPTIPINFFLDTFENYLLLRHPFAGGPLRRGGAIQSFFIQSVQAILRKAHFVIKW